MSPTQVPICDFSVESEADAGGGDRLQVGGGRFGLRRARRRFPSGRRPAARCRRRRARFRSATARSSRAHLVADLLDPRRRAPSRIPRSAPGSRCGWRVRRSRRSRGSRSPRSARRSRRSRRAARASAARARRRRRFSARQARLGALDLAGQLGGPLLAFGEQAAQLFLAGAGLRPPAAGRRRVRPGRPAAFRRSRRLRPWPPRPWPAASRRRRRRPAPAGRSARRAARRAGHEDCLYEASFTAVRRTKARQTTAFC